MGSTSAHTHNAHLNWDSPFFKGCKLNTQPRATLLIGQRKPKLPRFSNERYFKKLRGIVCSAVEQQRETGSGSLNGTGSSSGGEIGETDLPFFNVCVLFKKYIFMGKSASKKLIKKGESDDEGNAIYNFLYPGKELLPDDKEMNIYDHLEELRERIFVSILAIGAAMIGCFAFSKELVIFLEAPVKAQGVRFLQLAPGEFFFTSLKVSGYCGLLIGGPVILFEIIAFILPGLTKAERRFLGPIVLGSSILFYAGITFSYYILTPAALAFFVSYAEGVVESLWSIDQYFEFVLVLMLSTGLSFQVPVIQLLLGQLGLVSSEQMLSIWRYVVVGSVIAAAILTPSTDPLTQMLLAGPLMCLYLGGAWMVKALGR
ncbi:Sec-independent periplasmic protein translocase [Dorcoceras hygrometricum]|uniref:Sec-independent periplasmic protein translocase n=1 Tax=Dorcoceras hygrometricum TaxID=472368 RepID=A0A2Z7AD32_9LAMI|nr:Sec-independent periplasmic protein translocase [Dorcoceras hygrometricum]